MTVGMFRREIDLNYGATPAFTSVVHGVVFVCGFITPRLKHDPHDTGTTHDTTRIQQTSDDEV